MEGNNTVVNERERSKSLMLIKPHQQHRILTTDKGSNGQITQIPDNSKRSNSLLIQPSLSNGIANINRPPYLSPMISIPSLSTTNKTENMKGIATSLDSIIQGAPNTLMRLKLDNTDSKESKEYLRKRIKDLEKDVLKLTNHIQQAEHSIKNYRHCLSEKSPRYEDGLTKSISIQTDIDQDNSKLEQELKSSQEKINSLLNELKTLRELKDTFFKERKQLHEIHQQNEHKMKETIKAKEDIIKSQQFQIKSLEDTISVYRQNKLEVKCTTKEDHTIIPIVKLFDTNTYQNHLKDLRDSLSEVKSYCRKEILNISDTIRTEYQNILQSMILSFQSTITNQKTNIEELNTKIDILQNRFNCSKEQLEIANIEIERLKVVSTTAPTNALNNSNQIHTMMMIDDGVNNISDISQESLHIPQHVAEPSIPFTPAAPMNTTKDMKKVAVALTVQDDVLDSLRVISIDQGCSPFLLSPTTVPLKQQKQLLSSSSSPMQMVPNHNQSPQETKYKLYIAELELEYQEKISQLESQHQQVEMKQRLQMNRQDAIYNDKLKQIEGQYKQQVEACNIVKDKLMSQFNQEQIHSKQLQQCIHDANHALHSLQEVHVAEIKAIKHESHIKDLVRINKEREVSIERDRLQIEINHLKEIQSVLSFSISTAEQSLEELQPHVVVKLSQGRTKRLKLIEQSNKLRLKDLDQRSLETCAVSGTHLDGFQSKASNNQKIAQEMTQLATNKLIDILKANLSS